ncbi:MAG: response regulator transcription factor [Lachnospiraceae bacterium]|nr:response regulator transcription factor [Lachnospiraceae bacterium]
MATNILLLEDDFSIASGLMYALEKEGYIPSHCSTIEEAVTAIREKEFQLAILDIQLPDGNGKEVGDLLMKKGVPVIFLTVVDDESEIVECLEQGAAEYITKPFRLRELLTRVKRSLRREEDNEQAIISVGDVSIDTTAGKVYVRGELVELTALEYRILLIFAMNRSTLLTREKILEKIWDSSGKFVEDNTLTVYIKRLREKLDGALVIETVRGMGYRVD